MTMSTVCTKSDELEIKIETYGAQMTSIKNKPGREFLWQGSPAWQDHAPVFFPIVGSLKDNSYTFNGQKYTMTPHGLPIKN